MIYVDKTEQIYALMRDRVPKFLSRPRRFGKSTLLSTVEELFTHGTTASGNQNSAFKGLAIDNKFCEDVAAYQILKLDFLAISQMCRNAEDFEQELVRQLYAFAEKAGVKLPEKRYSARDLTINARSLHLLQGGDEWPT